MYSRDRAGRAPPRNNFSRSTSGASGVVETTGYNVSLRAQVRRVSSPPRRNSQSCNYCMYMFDQIYPFAFSARALRLTPNMEQGDDLSSPRQEMRMKLSRTARGSRLPMRAFWLLLGVQTLLARPDLAGDASKCPFHKLRNGFIAEDQPSLSVAEKAMCAAHDEGAVASLGAAAGAIMYGSAPYSVVQKTVKGCTCISECKASGIGTRDNRRPSCPSCCFICSRVLS